MRVCHLPLNIASQNSVTVRALRDLGIDAVGLVRGGQGSQDAAGLKVFGGGSRTSPKWLAAKARYLEALFREIARADVIHWHFASTLPGDLDLKWARRLDKPGIVEFWGSDVRIPEREFDLNPYYKAAWPKYEHREMESEAGSHARQEKFVRHGIDACFNWPTCPHYLKPGLWRKVYDSGGRVLLDEYAPRYPDPDRRRPVLAHSPTAKVAKGTNAVIRAAEKLKAKHDLDFRLIHGVSHAEARRIREECDLFLDQFVLGDYGLSSVEALALGKPVACYLRPSTRHRLPEGCPIIDANPDNLAEVLEPYVADGALRRETGLRSRRFAERHHDAREYARYLIAVYEELIREKRANG